MITLSYGTEEVEIRNGVPVEDERQFDQSMISRRTRGGKLKLFRDAGWHDFDTILIRSKMNRDLADLRSFLNLTWGKVITMDVDYVDNDCKKYQKRLTGVVITPSQEIITLRDGECGAQDTSFEFLIETAGELP